MSISYLCKSRKDRYSKKLSRVYFVADCKLTARLKRASRFRIPFGLYFPENQMTEAMRRGRIGDSRIGKRRRNKIN